MIDKAIRIHGRSIYSGFRVFFAVGEYIDLCVSGDRHKDSIGIRIKTMTQYVLRRR